MAFSNKEYVLVPDAEFVARRDLAKFGFTHDFAMNHMRAAISVELLRHLDQNQIR